MQRARSNGHASHGRQSVSNIVSQVLELSLAAAEPASVRIRSSLQQLLNLRSEEKCTVTCPAHAQTHALTDTLCMQEAITLVLGHCACGSTACTLRQKRSEDWAATPDFFCGTACRMCLQAQGTPSARHATAPPKDGPIAIADVV